MTIALDHTIVPARDAVAAARQLAQLLDVPWGPAAVGPFTAVYVNDGLTLDFIDTDEDFPVYHFAFRVSQTEFGVILGRIEAAGIPYRSSVRGPDDRRVDPRWSNVYWNEPAGHQWEMLTVSFARQAD